MHKAKTEAIPILKRVDPLNLQRDSTTTNLCMSRVSS